MHFSLTSYENRSSYKIGGSLCCHFQESSVNIMATAGSFFVTVYIMCNSQLSCTCIYKEVWNLTIGDDFVSFLGKGTSRTGKPWL